MKYYLSLICILGSSIFLLECKPQKSQISQKLNFSSSLDTVIFNKKNEGNFIVYYFDGNCSACYLTFKKIKQNFRNIGIVGITPSNDTALIIYQFELTGIKTELLFDKDSIFYKENKKLLDENNIFMLDSTNTIINILKLQ